MPEKKRQQQSPTNGVVADTRLKMATFNLFNYLEPPNAFYDFQRIYTLKQWHKKQQWICDYIKKHQPDVIGFQEVFSPESLKTLLAELGYPYFQVIDQPQVVDDFIYSSPVVALACRYPVIETSPVLPDPDLAQAMGLQANFSFSRKVLRATIDLPHIGSCDCYVVHFKSKRPLFDSLADKDGSEQNLSCKELLTEKSVVKQLKAQVAGSWGSSVQRGSEAALLFVDMLSRRESSGLPAVLMGDFNQDLNDGVLSFLKTARLDSDNKADIEFLLKKILLKRCLGFISAIRRSPGRPGQGSQTQSLLWRQGLGVRLYFTLP